MSKSMIPKKIQNKMNKEINQVKVLVRHKRKYLLLRKARDIHPSHVGGWEVPGGKIKPNESPQEAGLREIQEETGLKCRIVAELKLLELEKDGIRTRTQVYLAEASSDDIKLSAEHSDYIWISVKALEKLDNIIYKDLFRWYLQEAEKVVVKN